MGPDLRLLQSGCGAAETDFNGALSAAETALTGAVCAAETDFHGMLPRSRSLSQLRGHAGAVAGEVCFSQDHDQVVDPVHRDVSVLAELEDDCVRRRKAGCSAGVASDMSRIQVDLVVIREFMGHSHLLLHVHVCLRVLPLLLLGLRVCLLYALVLMLMLQRLHVEGWL